MSASTTHPTIRALLAAMALVLAQPGAADELRAAWKAARGGAYQASSAAELAAARRLFAAEFVGGEEAETWAGLEMERLPIQLQGQDCALLREARSARRGRGFYLVCPDAPAALAIQIPHGFADLDTDDIGLGLAASGRLRAAAFNTVSRKDADLAHTENTWFSAFTAALAQSGSIDAIVQIHGFAGAQRQTPAARNAGFIVSNGTSRPDLRVTRLAAALSARFDRSALVYPRDVRELGGTTNVQGRLLRVGDSTAFVHLEIDRALRTQLRQHGAAVSSLLEALDAG